MVQQPDTENQGLLDAAATRKPPFQHWLLLLQLAALGLCCTGFGGFTWILSARIRTLQQALPTAGPGQPLQQFPSLVPSALNLICLQTLRGS